MSPRCDFASKRNSWRAGSLADSGRFLWIGQNRCAGQRLERRLLDAELVHGEVLETEFQGGRTVPDAVVAFSWVNEQGVGFEGMPVPAALLLKLCGEVRGGLPAMMQQIVVNLAAPRLFHADRMVRGKNNVTAEDVPAVAKPDMRVERIVHDDVILHDAIKTLAILEAAIETKVVANLVTGRAVVQIDVPAVIAAPAVVAQNDRFHHVEQRQLPVFAQHHRVQVHSFQSPVAVPAPRVERAMVA